MSEELNWKDVFREMEELGIKPEAPKQSAAPTQDTRLRTSFKEIVDFVRKEGRKPEKRKGVRERALAMRLAEFCTNPEKAVAVQDLDCFGLLPQSDGDLWGSEDEEMLSSLVASDIFDTSPLPQRKAQPDYVANRKPCKDFGQFESLFEQCKADLEQNHRHIVRIVGSHAQQSIGKGSFAIVYNLLAYVADEEEEYKTQDARKNRRLRVIFDNGTECDMLYRSLLSALYRDGMLISEYEDKELTLQAEGNGTETRKPAGFIYILSSASDAPYIKAVPNLFKIGVTTTTVESRIKNAKNEPTYLMADVKIVETFACFDINMHKLEALIHRFFAICQVDLEVTNAEGVVCRPHEWYSVPISVIRQAIDLIMDGSIVNYLYDKKNQRIVEKEGMSNHRAWL